MAEKFIPRDKLGKRSRKALDAKKRTLWEHSPVTRIVESKKVYNRKRADRNRHDDCGSDSALPF